MNSKAFDAIQAPLVQTNRTNVGAVIAGAECLWHVLCNSRCNAAAIAIAAIEPLSKAARFWIVCRGHLANKQNPAQNPVFGKQVGARHPSPCCLSITEQSIRDRSDVCLHRTLRCFGIVRGDGLHNPVVFGEAGMVLRWARAAAYDRHISDRAPNVVELVEQKQKQCIV